MDSRISFACQSDEIGLKEILVSYGMDLAGKIEEHVIIKQNETIIAGAKLSLIGNALFHLDVIGVRNDQRRTGAGGLLLSNLISRPWEYCNSPTPKSDGIYKITTISRGEAVSFYENHGFRRCNFSELEWPYDEQCETCPDQEECRPVPMVFMGGEKT